MSTISLRLPESLPDKARELAKQENVSINQVVATALAETLSALMTEEYLQVRAKRGSRRNFSVTRARKLIANATRAARSH